MTRKSRDRRLAEGLRRIRQPLKRKNDALESHFRTKLQPELSERLQNNADRARRGFREC